MVTLIDIWRVLQKIKTSQNLIKRAYSLYKNTTHYVKGKRDRS